MPALEDGHKVISCGLDRCKDAIRKGEIVCLVDWGETKLLCEIILLLSVSSSSIQKKLLPPKSDQSPLWGRLPCWIISEIGMGDMSSFILVDLRSKSLSLEMLETSLQLLLTIDDEPRARIYCSFSSFDVGTSTIVVVVMSFFFAILAFLILRRLILLIWLRSFREKNSFRSYPPLPAPLVIRSKPQRFTVEFDRNRYECEASHEEQKTTRTAYEKRSNTYIASESSCISTVERTLAWCLSRIRKDRTLWNSSRREATRRFFRNSLSRLGRASHEASMGRSLFSVRPCQGMSFYTIWILSVGRDVYCY